MSTQNVANISPTALITGASSGLGEEFARQLAIQGYNLTLTARRIDRLQEIAAVLTGQYGTNVNIVYADLASTEGIELVAGQIAALPELDLLVNNAGFGVVGSFSRTEAAKHRAMLQVHVTASVLLTHAALPGMLSRRKGSIINVASMAGLLPLRSVLYGSTKAFLIYFSQALAVDLTGKGVKVQALCPGFVYTEFHETLEYEQFDRRQIPKILWLTSEQVVRESLASLPRHKVICIPGMQYRLIGALARNCFTSSLIYMIGKKRFLKQE